MNRKFYAVLENSLTASLTNTFVWFAVTFWVYLQTKSVIATSVMAGVYLVTVALSGFFLGSLVDRYNKKSVMLLSSIGSFGLYLAATLVLVAAPAATFSDPTSVVLWVFIVLALVGAIAGNLRGIALSTLVTVMISEERRAKANGLVGTANGVAFLGASILSGVVIGFLSIFWVLVGALVLTLIAMLHLMTLSLPKKAAISTESEELGSTSLDIGGTIQAIRSVPGLFGLIFFSSFNNFLGGVFMSLMDAYGLQLVSVEVWGALWGFLSLGFIVGGLIVSKVGLGKSPLRTLFLGNTAIWTITIFFTMHSSIVLLGVGMFIFLTLMPIIEASEQTILQKVIPSDRQGRVFGFAQSIEQAASPITAFVIGPIAQLIFIPFMTTGAGVQLIGGWFGTGVDRGIALLFILAGIIGLIVTLAAMRSRSYKKLAEKYPLQKVEAVKKQPLYQG